MKRKYFLFFPALVVSITAACSSAPAPIETAGSNGGSNTATFAAANNVDPTINANVPTPAANSAIPGIPNAPANLKISKEDPTRNAKPQVIGQPAPDNSMITTSLGQDAVETRTFKNHQQLAKVERIQDLANKKTIVKVYLRNGQVREVPEGKISNPMAAPATEILQALQGAPAAAPAAGETKTENQQPKRDEKPVKQQQAPATKPQ